MSRKVRRLATSGVALALCAFASGETPPRLLLRDNHLILTGLPEVISAAEISKHLESGLTTTMAFEVSIDTPREKRSTAAALIEIRYELWEERYLIKTIDGRGPSPIERLSSAAALRQWWRGTALHLAEATQAVKPRATRAEVRLSVLPFSEREQQDAQRWFSDSMERGAGSNAPSSAAQGGLPTVQRVFGVMMATSIARRAVSTYTWQVILSEEAKP